MNQRIINWPLLRILRWYDLVPWMIYVLRLRSTCSGDAQLSGGVGTIDMMYYSYTYCILIWDASIFGKVFITFEIYKWVFQRQRLFYATQKPLTGTSCSGLS